MELHLEELWKEAQKLKPRHALLQIPEGLKAQATEIAGFFEGKGVTCTLLMDPCYGACDLADDKAKTLGADLLIHFGHSKMLHTGMRVIYWPIEYEVKKQMVQGLGNALSTLKKEKGIHTFGLYAAIQFSEKLKEIAKTLESQNLHCLVGQGDLFEGQLLGCDVSTRKTVEEKADANVYFGDGLFHALAIAFASTKPTYLYDPFTNEFKSLEKEKETFLRQRFALIAKAKDAKTFGIILSTKRGQLRKALALKLKALAEKHGKKALLLGMDYVKPEHVLGVKVDALVNTACSRLATDDWLHFPKPLLTPLELEIVLGEKDGSAYQFDEIKHYAGKVE
ncbi:MAG: diphthamide biosynthesis enzyme Dph2 [Candidatus Diapherotrites archaeon]|nr:diphthamide biosynthesis enzyme Dph2 [Candidatus Diapherotrites archaeon]